MALERLAREAVALRGLRVEIPRPPGRAVRRAYELEGAEPRRRSRMAFLAGGGLGGFGGDGAGVGGAGVGGLAGPVTVTRAVNFHVSEDTVGGAALSELRVYGPVASRFRVRRVVVAPIAGVAAGQFVDVLVSGDSDPTDTASPTGTSVFPALSGQVGLPAPDGQVGVAVPASTLSIDGVYEVPVSGQSIKVRVFAVAPAIAMPDVQVTVVIDELV